MKYDQRVRRFDNIYRWFRYDCSALAGSQWSRHSLVWLATDIDDRKRAEEALRASEHNFRVVIDSIPGLVIL